MKTQLLGSAVAVHAAACLIAILSVGAGIPVIGETIDRVHVETRSEPRSESRAETPSVTLRLEGSAREPEIVPATEQFVKPAADSLGFLEAESAEVKR